MRDLGKFGDFGGVFVPETLIPAIEELSEAFSRLRKDKAFNRELADLLETYAGRPTPLTFCPNLSRRIGCKTYLKREDLLHSGAHKINNALGQALIAKKLGKTRLIAETGAGQHGVAVATAGARLGIETVIYMGAVDVARQHQNVLRMRLLGATVHVVESGSKTLKDAINEALRDWAANVRNTHYLLGSVLGPHPFPSMVAHFQSVIGKEAKAQIKKAEGRMPNAVIACVGGGSNAIGIFSGFLKDKKVKLIGVEAGGKGVHTKEHASRFGDPSLGRIGVIHGTKTYVLQDRDGQIHNTSSLAAGLDYCAVGPMHSHLHETGRATYVSVTDTEALEGFKVLSEEEGIIPALESSHAIAYALKLGKKMRKNDVMIINLSGRGDKDLDQVQGMVS